MKNKKVLLFILIAVVLAVTGFAIYKMKSNKDVQVQKQITISVFDKENKNIYKETVETEKEYLIDILKEIEELKVVTENSEYGEYINSIMEVAQGDNYYWTYYIDDEYATTGVSNCKIQHEKTYNFKIESINY